MQQDGLRKRIAEIREELSRVESALDSPNDLLTCTARVNLLVQDLRAQAHRVHYLHANGSYTSAAPSR